MSIKVVAETDVVIIAPRGRFIGGNETVELESTLRSLIDQDNRKLVIDFANVELLTSRPLGVLAAAREDYRRRGGRIKLCNLDNRNRNPLIITRLIELFDVYFSVKEATASF